MKLRSSCRRIPMPSRNKAAKFKLPSKGRSANMRAVRSTGNGTTEWRLRALMIRSRVSSWRLRMPNVPGSPDFVFPKSRLAVFVDGCFWHGCPRCGHIPRTNRSYWRAKIARNKRRDNIISKTLRALKYRVVRIWECQLRNDPNRCLHRIVRATR